MSLSVIPATLDSIRVLRERYCTETGGQVVHDSLHRRRGWTNSYLLLCDGVAVGYGSVAVAGPWAGKVTVFEFYVVPGHRPRAFDLFERFLRLTQTDSFEVQTSGDLLTTLIHTHGENLESEKLVFRDQVTTALAVPDAVLRRTNTLGESRAHFLARDGSSEWCLELDGQVAATGGIAFHYNHPYGDVYMNVEERFRRRGLGAYLVQELKRVAYELGAVPGARCDPANVASRRTLLKAGFAPAGHILIGTLKRRPVSSAPFAPAASRP